MPPGRLDARPRLPCCRFLYTRKSADEGLLEEGVKAGGAKTEGAGDPTRAYRLGPRARHTIGAAGILGVVESVTNKTLDSQDAAGNLGVEFLGHAALLGDSSVRATYAAKAARQTAARREQGLEDPDEGGAAAKKGRGKGGKSRR